MSSDTALRTTGKPSAAAASSASSRPVARRSRVTGRPSSARSALGVELVDGAPARRGLEGRRDSGAGECALRPGLHRPLRPARQTVEGAEALAGAADPGQPVLLEEVELGAHHKTRPHAHEVVRLRARLRGRDEMLDGVERRARARPIG